MLPDPRRGRCACRRRSCAIAAAQLLAQTLDMPQHPDSMTITKTITDANCKIHYSGNVDTEAVSDGIQHY